MKTVQNQGDMGHLIVIIKCMEMSSKQEAMIQTHSGLAEMTQAEAVKCTDSGGCALHCPGTWRPGCLTLASLFTALDRPQQVIHVRRICNKKWTHSKRPLTLQHISCGILYSHEKGRSASLCNCYGPIIKIHNCTKKK